APTAGKLLSPTSTANEFQHLIVDYLPGQLKFAVDNGIPTIVYACATIGLGIGAGGDGTQNNFLKTYGSAAMPLATFFTTVTNLFMINNPGFLQTQYNSYLALYTPAGNLPPGYTSAADAARAAVFGIAAGQDLTQLTVNPMLIAQVENAKILNAETINGDVSGANGYQAGVALGALKTALPLQSGPTPPPTSNVFLTTGVDNP